MRGSIASTARHSSRSLSPTRPTFSQSRILCPASPVQEQVYCATLFAKGHSAKACAPTTCGGKECAHRSRTMCGLHRRAETTYLKLHDAVPSWFHHVPVAVVLVGLTVAPSGVACMVKVTVGAE